MPIFTTSVDQAAAAVTKAHAVVEEWQAKASAARAEAARLDAESGAMILADEAAAERISLSVQTLERKARAYDQATAEALRKLKTAQRDALEAEARDEDKQAAAARRRLDAHETKVKALLRQLKDLNGADYVPESLTNSVTGMDSSMRQPTRSGAMYSEVHAHEVRAAAIRYFCATGQVPTDYVELNNELGTGFPTFGQNLSEMALPASIYAARDAGLTFQEA